MNSTFHAGRVALSNTADSSIAHTHTVEEKETT